MEVHGEGTTIRNNVFAYNSGFGAAIWGNIASPLIERNIFRGNVCDTQHLSGVVSFINASRPKIQNNIFSNNACRAINLTIHSAAPLVTNNTIVGNRVGIYVWRVPVAAHAYQNNILVDNGIGVESASGAVLSASAFDHNLVFGNDSNYVGMPDQTGVSGNTSVDPRFISAATEDYRLRWASPAIDSGASASVPSSDFFGASRPADGDLDGVALTDIGAHEFVICADVTGDGRVTSRDIGEIARRRGKPGFGIGDVNFDGVNDKKDIDIARRQKGTEC